MGTFIPYSIDTMTHDEKKFFKELGARVATLRKEQGVTQVQLGEMLGIAQQMVASYEVGRRRIPVSMLPKLAHALAVPLEALLGVSSSAAKRGPTPKLQQQMERIHRLPKTRQKFVMEMLETVLSQTGR
jgi:transcriptional regulator with XRE-family HTH domain